jgi:hypothetical protein
MIFYIMGIYFSVRQAFSSKNPLFCLYISVTDDILKKNTADDHQTVYFKITCAIIQSSVKIDATYYFFHDRE